jgi:hypothetical protein
VRTGNQIQSRKIFKACPLARKGAQLKAVNKGCIFVKIFEPLKENKPFSLEQLK